MITDYAQLIRLLPSPLYKFLAQRWIDKEYPRHIFIETTASCNLTCNYCPREKFKDHMEWETFKKIVDEATQYGPRSFSLHLFGEPLLYPKWYEAIRYIKSRNKRHTVLFTTNGTMLEKGDNFARLKDSGIDKVLWSWRTEPKWSDGFKDKLRGWRKFTVRFIEGLYPEGEELLWPHREKRSLHNYGGEISLERFGVKSTAGKRYPCYHLWYAPAVSWDGCILLCCADPHKKMVLGNIKTMTLSQAWKSQKFEKERENHRNGVYKGICENCNIWKQYPNIF